MQLTFILKNTKPLSVNAANLNSKKHNRRYKSDKYHLLEQRVRFLLMARRKEIQEFEDKFDQSCQHIQQIIKVYVPKSKMFRKKDDGVSMLKGDNNNQIKVIQDIIYKSFNKLDDKLDCNTHKMQLVSPDNEWHIHFIIKARENSLLYE